MPKIIIFDVNETLLDLTPLKESVSKALDKNTDLLPLWFTTMLQYALVETLTDEFHSFEQIGSAALVMIAEKNGIEMTLEDAEVFIMEPLRTLPAHADVMSGLKALSAKGYRLVCLSNSSAVGLKSQLENAGLIPHIEKFYSVEGVSKYKPHSDTYRMVLEDLGAKPEEVLMVAAHAWDLAGAKNVGLQTAFIKRPGAVLYPLTDRPDYIADDLLDLNRYI